MAYNFLFVYLQCGMETLFSFSTCCLKMYRCVHTHTHTQIYSLLHPAVHGKNDLVIIIYYGNTCLNKFFLMTYYLQRWDRCFHWVSMPQEYHYFCYSTTMVFSLKISGISYFYFYNLFIFVLISVKVLMQSGYYQMMKLLPLLCVFFIINNSDFCKSEIGKNAKKPKTKIAEIRNNI